MHSCELVRSPNPLHKGKLGPQQVQILLFCLFGAITIASTDWVSSWIPCREGNWGSPLHSRTHFFLLNPISQCAFVITPDPQEGHLENNWFRTTYLPDSLATITVSLVCLLNSELLGDYMVWDTLAWLCCRFPDLMCTWNPVPDQAYRMPSETQVCLPHPHSSHLPKAYRACPPFLSPTPFNRTLQANPLSSLKPKWLLFAKEVLLQSWKLKHQVMSHTTTRGDSSWGP